MTDLVKQGKDQAVSVHRRVIGQSTIDANDAVAATHECLGIDGGASLIELEQQIGKRLPEIGQDVAKQLAPACAGARIADQFANGIREQHEIIQESEQFARSSVQASNFVAWMRRLLIQALDGIKHYWPRSNFGSV